MKRLPFDSFILLMVLITIVLLVISVNCGPGTIYYRKPTKLVFYKKYPPVLVYPKKADYIYPQKLKAIEHSHQVGGVAHALPDRQHVKYGKYFLLNPNFLEHLLNYEKKKHSTRIYDGWLFNGNGNNHKEHINAGFGSVGSTSYSQFVGGTTSGVQFNEPVFSYYPKKYLNIARPSNLDIKPVVEHIEDDLKYDFRTKTHSYSDR